MAWMIAAGSILGGLSVALGAGRRHIVDKHTSAAGSSGFSTGVQYQFVHALGLIVCGLLAAIRPSGSWTVGGVAFTAGVVLFSGSLYLLACAPRRWLGPITPLGGVAFLVGWAALAIGAFSLSSMAPR